MHPSSTLNEFISGNQANRYVILNCKVVDYINFILRAGEFKDCPFEKVGNTWRIEYILQKLNYIFAFPIISVHWDGTGI